jgi:hypothetical protein
MEFERYWIFAACCAVVVAFLVRLLLRERVALQHSLAFLLFMLGLVTVAVFPGLTNRVAQLMGFTLASNFFFAALIGVLVLLHLGTVIALSKLESRTVALTQEIGLMQEQLARLTPSVARFPVGPLPDEELSNSGKVAAPGLLPGEIKS